MSRPTVTGRAIGWLRCDIQFFANPWGPFRQDAFDAGVQFIQLAEDVILSSVEVVDQ